VVDAPDLAVVTAQHVAALAVGAVGHEVERGNPGQLGLGLRSVLEKGEVVLLGVAAAEPLQRADAQVGVLPDYGRRDEPPAQRFDERLRGAVAIDKNG